MLNSPGRRSLRPARTVRVSFLLVLTAVSVLCVENGLAGTRPRHLDVWTSSSGDETILATSGRGTTLSAFFNGVLTTIEVGGPSHDVVHVDGRQALATLVDQDAVALLERLAETQAYADDAMVLEVPHVSGDGVLPLRYSTAALAVPGTDRVLIANRGHAPREGEAWMHAVHEVAVDGATGRVEHVRTFVTERAPSALALSPDGDALFVATLQGSMGGLGLGLDGDHALARDVFDGGTILQYPYDATATVAPPATRRFLIGSPVRGLAIVDGHELATPVDEYTLHFSHVGAGAGGEDPEFGGKKIPNVLSSIRFERGDDTPVPNSRRNVVLSHCPDLDACTVAPNEPFHVVPDDLTVTYDANGAARLWASFSGSGSVAVMDLTEFGEIHVLDPQEAGADAFLHLWDLDGRLEFVTARNANGGLSRVLASPSTPDPVVASTALEYADPQHFADIELVDSGFERSARPRGLAAVSSDEVLVAVEFENRIERLTSVSGTIGSSVVANLGGHADLPSNSERRFFTAGGGFDFREAGTGTFVSPVDRVDNITCGTCHPEGQLDGKVRVTKRDAAMIPSAVRGDPLFDSEPVAVPSLLDVSETEWLFFEGFKTMEDNGIPGCGYCVIDGGAGRGFFPNTVDFTRELASGISPYARTGSIVDSGTASASAAEAGRWWFDELNCSRCHVGSIDAFARTDDPDFAEIGGGTGSRMLHDMTQQMITGDVLTPNGISNASLRNGSNVGTRDRSESGGTQSGGRSTKNTVNTPAIANAWDASPFMHDGRYRTLEDVLRNTWLRSWNAGPTGLLAAPRWTEATVQDNFANDTSRGLDTSKSSVTLEATTTSFFFQTHRASDPGTAPASPNSDAISVHDYLGARASITGDGSALGDMIAFLKSVSAETALCEDATPLSVSGLKVKQMGQIDTQGANHIVSWRASVPARFRVRVTSPQGQVYFETREDARGSYLGDSTYRTAEFQMPFGAEYIVDVRARQPRGVCAPGPLVVASVTGNAFGFGNIPRQTKVQLRRTVLGSVHPNPFNPMTRVEFALAEPTVVQIEIYDARGRRVRTLLDEQRSPGTHTIDWGGQDDDGGTVAAGTYFVRMRAGEYSHVRRVTMVK